VDKRRFINPEDGTEVVVKDNIERDRRPAVTLFREEDARAVRYRTPEYRRVNRTGLRERIILRLPYKSCKGAALRGEPAFYSPEVLRKEELPIEPDAEEAGRLARRKDGVLIERERLRRDGVGVGEVEEYTFRRLEHDAFRPYLRFDRSLRLL